MVYRLSAIAVVGAGLLDLLRLQRLLRPTEAAASWQIILIAAAILGAVITWVARTYQIGRLGTIALNFSGMALAVVRIGAPETLRFGILPTAGTLTELGEELGFALQLLRFGNAPVVPVVGLVVILALVFWLFGMLAVWGLTSNHPWLGTVPPLMFYLQLSTIDRAPSSLPWTIAFLLLLAAAIAGVAGEDRLKGAGRLRGADGLAIQRTGWAAPIGVIAGLGLIAMLGTAAAADRVPESGVLEWRSRSGLGDGIYGGVSYNLYAGIVQESLLSLSDEPVFVARVSDSEIRPNEMYWRLVTLDSFDGENWFLTNRGSRSPSPDEPWEGDGYDFRGPTVPVDQVIQIRSLEMNYLPALYAPSGLTSETSIVTQSLRVRNDASIRFDALTFEGLTYRVRSDVPRPDIDVLATVNGELSPVFATASDEAAFDGSATAGEVTEPDDLEDFLELPDDLDVRLLALARDITLDATGPFEEALFLERFLRNTGPNGFTYSVDIEPGHSAQNLADWLLDPESPSYRTGYCEQFATSLAVLARARGIPSRVVIGFTPGDVQDDGLIVVRQRNAHSWVELWMDGQGWVRFDPTPRRAGDNPSAVDSLAGFDPALYVPEPEEFTEDVIIGPDGQPIPFGPERDEFLENPEDILDQNAPFVAGGDAATQPGISWQWIAVSVVGTVVAAIPVTKWVRRRLRLRRLRSGDISAAWDEVLDRLTDLRYDVSEWKTPAEIATTTEPSLTALAAVYGETVYGPERSLGTRQIEIGTASFQSAESVLRHRHSRWQTIRSWLTPSSLRRKR